MVGDGYVLKPPRAAGLHHLQKARFPIGPIGVDMEVAENFGKFQEFREGPGLGGLDLALVLPQLRRDEGEAQGLIDFLLGAASEHPIFLVKEPILVEFPAAGHSAFPQPNVVGFGPGEVLPGGAERFLGDDAQIGLQSPGKFDRGFFRPLGQNFLDLGEGTEGPGRLLGIPGNPQDIEVAHRFLPAAKGAGQFDPLE